MCKILQALGICYVPAEYYPDNSSEVQKNFIRANSKKSLTLNRLFVFGREIFLTSSEDAVISLLFKLNGKFATRNDILNILNDDGEIDERSVDQIVKRLRRKIFPNNQQAGAMFIQTKYGCGYRIPTRAHLNS
jgi:DNA-binding response OmpR family regulator